MAYFGMGLEAGRSKIKVWPRTSSSLCPYVVEKEQANFLAALFIRLTPQSGSYLITLFDLNLINYKDSVSKRSHIWLEIKPKCVWWRNTISSKHKHTF